MVGIHHARTPIAHRYYATARRHWALTELLPELIVLVVSLSTIAGLWMAIGRYSATELVRLENRLEQVGTTLAVALAAETEGTLNTARQAAALIARTYAQDHAHMSLSYWSELHQMDAFPRASIIDAQGTVISTSTASDSFDYTTLLGRWSGSGAAPGQLVVGDPVLMAPDRWRIPAFMRISDANGDAAGFVVIWIKAEDFDTTYRKTALSPEDTMTVIGSDGIVRTQLGRPVSPEDGYDGYLHKILTSGGKPGVFISTAPGKGTNAGAKTRITAHRGIEGYPLLAVVSLDYNRAFTAFHARVRTYDEVVGAASGVVTLLAAALILILRKQRMTAHALQTQLAEEALHDTLTGLANRSLFQDHCGRAISRAQRHVYQMAVLYVDLDNFKRINDQYGHTAGDLVLQEVSTRLQSCVRATSEDLVARLGGDEFCIILSNVTRTQCEMIVGKILSTLATPMDLGVPFQITASIGAALFPDDAGDMETLIELADRGMYEAKRAGKNQFAWKRAAGGPQGRRDGRPAAMGEPSQAKDEQPQEEDFPPQRINGTR